MRSFYTILLLVIFLFSCGKEDEIDLAEENIFREEHFIRLYNHILHARDIELLEDGSLAVVGSERKIGA